MKRILIPLLAICIPIALIEIAGSADGPTTDKDQKNAAQHEKNAPDTRAAGLGNLTQDTAGMLVHFANGDTQRWMLARLINQRKAARPNSIAFYWSGIL